MKNVSGSWFALFLLSVGIVHAADDWVQQFPSTSPSARSSHATAYIGGDRLLLFGGWVGTWNGETWVYDYSDGSWTQQSPASSPTAREGHAMAYIGGDQVLLFGGNDGASDGETWVYDLSDTTWTRLFPASSPTAREDHAMASTGGGHVVLFGGWIVGWNAETWVYDVSDTTWTRVFPAFSPTARSDHAMASIGGDRVLLFGGSLGAAPWRSDETWVYDLSDASWTQLSPSSKPSARYEQAMAYIGADQVLLFGGNDGSFDNETWVYDLSDTAWTQDTNMTQPSARAGHTVCETSANGSSSPVLFGGWTGGANGETWMFGGGDYLFPFEAMVLGIALTSADTARISWSTVTGATNYDLYRSLTAFFDPSGAPWQTVAAPATHLDFADGVGDATTNYYFLGIARSTTQTSSASNVVGEFDAALP